MSHVFLIGFMGAGKSTVGKIVAERLGLPFMDLDDTIEQSAGRSVREIFDSEGEATFRELESQALASLSDVEPSVVACGGGVVISPENRTMLKSSGIVVYLRVSAGETLARLGDDDTRPLLAGPGGLIAATALLDARESLYEAVADIAVETIGRTPDEVASTVAQFVAAEAA